MGVLGNLVDKGRLNENIMLYFAIIFIAAVVLSIILAGKYIDEKDSK